MLTAKVFENGRSQAVRLPKEFRFSDDEVLAAKIGDVVMLMPKSNPWSGFLQGIAMMDEDFMAEGRSQGVAEEREALDVHA